MNTAIEMTLKTKYIYLVMLSQDDVCWCVDCIERLKLLVKVSPYFNRFADLNAYGKEPILTEHLL